MSFLISTLSDDVPSKVAISSASGIMFSLQLAGLFHCSSPEALVQVILAALEVRAPNILKCSNLKLGRTGEKVIIKASTKLMATLASSSLSNLCRNLTINPNFKNQMSIQ